MFGSRVSDKGGADKFEFGDGNDSPDCVVSLLEGRYSLASENRSMRLRGLLLRVLSLAATLQGSVSSSDE